MSSSKTTIFASAPTCSLGMAMAGINGLLLGLAPLETTTPRQGSQPSSPLPSIVQCAKFRLLVSKKPRHLVSALHVLLSCHFLPIAAGFIVSASAQASSVESSAVLFLAAPALANCPVSCFKSLDDQRVSCPLDRFLRLSRLYDLCHAADPFKQR